MSWWNYKFFQMHASLLPMTILSFTREDIKIIHKKIVFFMESTTESPTNFDSFIPFQDIEIKYGRYWKKFVDEVRAKAFLQKQADERKNRSHDHNEVEKQQHSLVQKPRKKHSSTCKCEIF